MDSVLVKIERGNSGPQCPFKRHFRGYDYPCTTLRLMTCFLKNCKGSFKQKALYSRPLGEILWTMSINLCNTLDCYVLNMALDVVRRSALAQRLAVVDISRLDLKW